MDTIKSFKGYGKVDEAENRAFQKKTRKRCVIVGISAVVLIAVIVAAVATVIIRPKSSGQSDSSTSTSMSLQTELRSLCKVTLYPENCYSSLLSAAGNTSIKGNPALFLSKLSLRVAVQEMSKLSGYTSTLASEATNNLTKAALNDCQTLFDDAIESLNDTASLMEEKGTNSLLSGDLSLRTWLSSSLTNLDTCLEGLHESNFSQIEEVRNFLTNSTEFTSNSLAIVSKVSKLLSGLNIPEFNRKLLSVKNDEEFPDWVTPGARKLLQTKKPTPTVTVAADGSGNVKTLKEAVAQIPKKSATAFIIYVKKGKYVENIILDKSRWNVMIYGDGMGVTIISGSLNFVDGTPTFSTATFAAVGKGFIAKEITFENTAGAAKHQAVAFRSGSDQSVFYQCEFNAFQDTLYAHSNRQFYRECKITGTIDFIFGNSASVFQNCDIMPRQPLSNQFDTITAQGKSDPNQNTGISIQKCTISAFDALTAKIYLGRPWKIYSTTVIMESTIGSFLNPSGWIEWTSGVVPPSTIFYAEYQNTGAGSSTANRVTWPGYRPSITADVASQYTVSSFIDGGKWLPQTSVTYQGSLNW